MKLKTLTSILAITLLSISALALSILIYARYLYPNADYSQIVITVLSLSPDVIKDTIMPLDYVWGLIFFIIAWPLCYLYLSTSKQFIAATIMGLGALYLTGWPEFIILSHTTSTLYENQYVYPNKNITPPKHKRNLILIYLESFEQTFTKAEHYETNLIPHLNALQKNGNYSKEYRSIEGANYSIAALVATHCGVPLFFLQENDMFTNNYFLPNTICFPELLKENNYQTKIIKAADINYTNADKFALIHGYQSAWGTNQIIAKYPEFTQPKYKGAFGGLTDRALYQVAQKELAEFSPDKPFLLTLFSLDTHTPPAPLDTTCQKQYNDLRDSFICADTAIGEFIDWLKASPYWENTTVIILGDHLLPGKIKTKGHPQRTIYNTFLNLPQNIILPTDKIFTALDIPASILEILNFPLEQHAFGLGRSIFTDKPTLLEQGKLNKQLLQYSEFYNKLTALSTSHTEIYTPYTLGKTLNNSECINYTDLFENVLRQYYIDRLNFQLTSLPQNVSTLKVYLKFNAIFHRNNTLSIMVNNTEVKKFSPGIKDKPPYILEFSIPAHLITDNNLQLKFHNNTGTSRATTLGIAPLEIHITAE